MPLLAGVMDVHLEASCGFISWTCDERKEHFALSALFAAFGFILYVVSYVLAAARSRLRQVQVKITSVFLCFVFLFNFSVWKVLMAP